MIGFYVMGGGLGHLTRIKTFIDNFEIAGSYRIITANDLAFKLFNKDEVILLSHGSVQNPHNLRKKLIHIFESHAFTKIFIDTFPNGILGELDQEIVVDAELHYLGRRLKWATYERYYTGNIHFEQSYLFEKLEEAHEAVIKNISVFCKNVTLQYPHAIQTNISHKHIELPSPLWLITHTCHTEELQILVDHALDIASMEEKKPHLLVLSDKSIDLPENATWLTNERSIDWFPKAKKIFSGAGFNTWYQLGEFRDKHVCIPFERRFDDQFWRSRQK